MGALIGIRKAQVSNMALQIKLLWRIIYDPSNLWVSLIKAKYLKEEPIWSYTSPANTSWQWTKLLSLRDTFKQGLRWQVGDGSLISFWDDNWVYPFPISKICPIIEGYENLKVSKVISLTKNWDVGKIIV